MQRQPSFEQQSRERRVNSDALQGGPLSKPTMSRTFNQTPHIIKEEEEEGGEEGNLNISTSEPSTNMPFSSPRSGAIKIPNHKLILPPRRVPKRQSEPVGISALRSTDNRTYSGTSAATSVIGTEEKLNFSQVSSIGEEERSEAPQIDVTGSVELRVHAVPSLNDTPELKSPHKKKRAGWNRAANAATMQA